MTTEKRIIPEERVVEPTQSAAPRKVSVARTALLAGIVLAALAVAVAVYLDRSDGTLFDKAGIISRDQEERIQAE